jgi:hypothetical protein
MVCLKISAVSQNIRQGTVGHLVKNELETNEVLPQHLSERKEENPQNLSQESLSRPRYEPATSLEIY